MTGCINVYLATQPVARSLLSCGVRPSVCHVYVSKRPILLSNFLIAWWLHHSSFPKVDPTMKFRQGHPQQGPQIEVGYTKNLQFSTSISEIPIPNTEVFQNTEPTWKKIPTKIPIPTPNTDTDPALILASCCLSPMRRNSVLEELRVSTLAL